MGINLVSLTGNAAQLIELATNPEANVDFHEESVEQIGSDTFSVGSYCLDEAIPILEARGLTVVIEMDAAAFAAHIATLQAQATDLTGIV